jgi:hypothetical protein
MRGPWFRPCQPCRSSISLAFCCNFASVCVAEERVRIATYNIRYLNVAIHADRADALQKVVSKLQADIIGLQEIDNKAALAAIFPPAKWTIVIDDKSGDNQDLALVVRKGITVLLKDGSPLRYDADGTLLDRDKLFLFPKAADNSGFPKRRDVLCLLVKLLHDAGQFHVMVHHAKSRYRGRAATAPRRAEASKQLIRKLDAAFDGKEFVLLGDFNDSPDDKSLNILETGTQHAVAAKEGDEGAFLVNLTEPLFAVKVYILAGQSNMVGIYERIVGIPKAAEEVPGDVGRDVLLVRDVLKHLSAFRCCRHPTSPIGCGGGNFHSIYPVSAANRTCLPRQPIAAGAEGPSWLPISPISALSCSLSRGILLADLLPAGSSLLRRGCHALAGGAGSDRGCGSGEANSARRDTCLPASLRRG